MSFCLLCLSSNYTPCARLGPRETQQSARIMIKYKLEKQLSRCGLILYIYNFSRAGDNKLSAIRLHYYYNALLSSVAPKRLYIAVIVAREKLLLLETHDRFDD